MQASLEAQEEPCWGRGVLGDLIQTPLPLHRELLEGPSFPSQSSQAGAGNLGLEQYAPACSFGAEEDPAVPSPTPPAQLRC